MPTKKTNRKFWILGGLLLLLSLTAAVKWYPKTSREIPPEFVIRDSTIITPGPMEIKIWDYSVEDGDTVNVLFDGKKIFKKLLIKNQPVSYKPGYIDTGRHWIGIEAISEGTIGAATVHVSLSNGMKAFEFDIEARKNQPACRLIIVK